MLTVTVRPELKYNNLEWYPSSQVMPDPNEIFKIINDQSYFYIENGSTINRVSESLAFNIPENNMETIPSSAIINNVKLIVRTQKMNPYGVYDNLTLKFNGEVIANIDATAHNNELTTTEFMAETLNNLDIYRSILTEGSFEVTLSTEGRDKFKLMYIIVQVTYTEITHTSVCKVQCKNGLVTLPLYNPVKLSRYALRLVTPSGIKAFDLVSTLDPSASPLRVWTSSGLMAIRFIIEKDEDEGGNTVSDSLIALGEDSTTKFELNLDNNLKLVTRSLPSDDIRPAIINWYLESPSGIKYILLINSSGVIRTEFASDQNIEVLDIHRISKDNVIYEIKVTDSGDLQIVSIVE